MAEQMLDMAAFRELLAKKWLEPTAKREDLAHLQALSLSERRACSIVNAHRKMIREHGLTRCFCCLKRFWRVVTDPIFPNLRKLTQRPGSIGNA